MNVAIAFSSAYFESGCVAIKSLLESNSNDKELQVYVVPQNLSQSNVDFIQSIARPYQKKIIFVDTSLFDSLIAQKKVQLWFGSYISYSKLFADVLLPSVDRILLLDADVFVNKDLLPLWNFDLKGKTVGGVQDLTEGYFFNAGILLVDLSLWRKRGYREKVDQLLATQKQSSWSKIFSMFFSRRTLKCSR
jgi:lipopolysaccharide biosynthesis glycosyltransferase